jgi:drug/metabolite transporter (DMT)-like permease
VSSLTLSAYGFAMATLAGVVLLPFGGGPVMPDGTAALALLCGLLVGVAAYYAITAAMRVGEVAVVTPFRYARLIFALILGMAVFGERPDALTLLGAAIIIASGLYTLLREQRLRRVGVPTP